MAESLAVELVEKLTLAVDRRPRESELRPVHAHGVGAAGVFVASPVARDFCVARHFDGAKVGATVRFSNGSGATERHDGWSDVRGMAVRFDLPDGAKTDLIAMTLPEFFTRTDVQFAAFADDAKPMPCVRASPWRKILDMLRLTPPMPDPYPGQRKRPDDGAIAYANRKGNGFAQLAVFQAAMLGAPLSYIRAVYHAVHTFIVTAPDGTRRHVRFSWQPVDGVLNLDPKRPEDRELIGENYLNEQLRRRLARGPARFSLMMAIGEIGDDFNDPSRPWPPQRARVMMGTLTLDRYLGQGCEKMSFNPWLLTEGVEASEDPVMRVRREAYETSSAWRGGDACPFSGTVAG